MEIAQQNQSIKEEKKNEVEEINEQNLLVKSEEPIKSENQEEPAKSANQDEQDIPIQSEGEQNLTCHPPKKNNSAEPKKHTYWLSRSEIIGCVYKHLEEFDQFVEDNKVINPYTDEIIYTAHNGETAIIPTSAQCDIIRKWNQKKNRQDIMSAGSNPNPLDTPVDTDSDEPEEKKEEETNDGYIVILGKWLDKLGLYGKLLLCMFTVSLLILIVVCRYL